MPDTNFNPHIEPDLAHVEALLKSLHPGAPRLSRDHLLFHAGRLSAPPAPWPRRPWFWPTATAAAMLLAMTLAALLTIRPVSLPTERIVYVPTAAPAHPSGHPDSSPALPEFRAASVSERTNTLNRPTALATPRDVANPPEHGPAQAAYLVLRNQVLARGLDALPSPPPQPTTERDETLDELLGPTRPGWLRFRSLDLDAFPTPGARS